MFLFGPIGGLAAGRLDKRRVLYTQTLSGLLAGVFAVLIATGTIEMWMVFLLALALGGVNVFDNPARQAFIPGDGPSPGSSPMPSPWTRFR
jgi:hypothetical protein